MPVTTDYMQAFIGEHRWASALAAIDEKTLTDEGTNTG